MYGWLYRCVHCDGKWKCVCIDTSMGNQYVSISLHTHTQVSISLKFYDDLQKHGAEGVSCLDCSLRTHLHKCLYRMIVSYNPTISVKWRQTNPAALKWESKGSTKYEYQRIRSTESEHEEHGNTEHPSPHPSPPFPHPFLLLLIPPLPLSTPHLSLLLPLIPPSFFPSLLPSFPSLLPSFHPIHSHSCSRENMETTWCRQSRGMTSRYSSAMRASQRIKVRVVSLTLSQGRQNSAGGLSQT